jgi:hypothetical protein
MKKSTKLKSEYFTDLYLSYQRGSIKHIKKIMYLCMRWSIASFMCLLIFEIGYANNELEFNIKNNSNTQIQNILMRCKSQYISDNISCPKDASWTHTNGAQNVFTANVPLISTYNTEPFGLMWPALSLQKKVADTSLYFVVQQKLDNELLKETGDNVTVKYHSLIADGINTGVNASNNKILEGQFTLQDYNGNNLINYPRHMVISAHDNLWSGADNDPILREMITTNTSKDNSVIYSKLIVSNDIKNATFIDQINIGVKNIVTVHVLLNELDFENFTAEMTNSLYDNMFLEKYIVKQQAIPAIVNGLELYRKIIIQYKS